MTNRILITSGPTRQHLDPVRYLTNASSGRMGCALARAALELGHEVVVVSGPVEIDYPSAAERIDVVSTEAMLEACQERFPRCDGMIGTAAPCDYRPIHVEPHKIRKTGDPLILELEETADIVASLGSERNHQWLVGFALETQDHRLRALAKLEAKSCDLMVLNGPEAMNAPDNHVEVMDQHGKVVGRFSGTKYLVAQGILDVIQQRLIESRESKVES